MEKLIEYRLIMLKYAIIIERRAENYKKRTIYFFAFKKAANYTKVNISCNDLT